MRAPTFYLMALTIAVADQVSKWAVLKAIPPGGSVPVLGRFLSLTHTQNSGGAFSLFQAKNGWFIAIAIAAMAALLYAYHKSPRRDLYISAAIALALGGAIGNLIDRVFRHAVIDFFDVHFWPVFNVADSAITVGIIVLAWHFLFRKERTESRATSEPESLTPNA